MKPYLYSIIYWAAVSILFRKQMILYCNKPLSELAATLPALFIVPVLFVVITRFSYDKRQLTAMELKAKNEAGDNRELKRT